MATPNDIARPARPMSGKLGRGFVLLLGAAAVFWGLLVLPLFWQDANPQSLAAKLLDNQKFRLQALLDAAQQAEKAAQRSFCVPAALHSLFVLRLFILNQAIDTANQTLVESSYTPVLQTAHKALSCAPADSFIWLTLFWLDSGKRGINDNNLGYLRLSYVLGPNEGWVGLWRLQLAFLVFERLPPDLSNQAVADFINLVNTQQFYGQAAKIFENSSPAIQNRIIEMMKATSITTRQSFATILHQKGIDVAIPGVEKETRPWR